MLRIDATLNVAKEHNPQMISIIDEAVFGPETGGFCNMFIMKKEDFFAYCKWLFDILFVLYQHIKDEDLDVCTKRNVGWTAERLSSVFFFALAKNHTHEDLEVIELKNLKKLSWCKYVKALVFAKIKKNKQKYLRQINRYRLFNFIQN